ncbi:MAG TPA: hypothetical protein VLM37_12830, partial [Fibrobacteraceae bacterium]|nr:hypothetical protein [Fibrobacteraceae bacterium]
NKGDISGLSTKFSNAGGVVGYCKNTKNDNDSVVRIYNTYNVGSVSGVNYAGQILGYSNNSLLYASNYYLADDKSDTTAIGHILDDDGDKDVVKSGWAMLESEMTAESFVSLLGSAFAFDSAGINDGYPILTETVPELLSSPIESVPVTVSAVSWQAFGQNHEILLTGVDPGASVAIYDLQGRVQWKGTAQGPSLFASVPHSGLFIVQSGGLAQNVIVH